jgi:hypothetical protein
MLSPIPITLAGHSHLNDAGMLGRALDRWCARQGPNQNAFTRRGQAPGPRGITEEEYSRARQEKNDRNTLKKWGVRATKGNLAEIRAKAKAEREQAARDKAAADYAARLAALPEHIRSQYSLVIGENRAWQRLKTAEWLATLSVEEQDAILAKRRTAKSGGRS